MDFMSVRALTFYVCGGQIIFVKKIAQAKK